MIRQTFPLGRFFDVDVRVHLSVPLLLLLSIGLAAGMGLNLVRGVALWGALGAAVLVREVARCLAATYAGRPPLALVLFPTGGILALAGSSEGPTRRVSFVGPVANLVAAGMLLGFAYALQPGVNLVALPWIEPGHILRSVVWLQVLIGLVGLLPMPVAGRNRATVQDSAEPVAAAKKPVPRFGIVSAIAMAMIVAGFVTPAFYWLSGLGIFLLIGTQLARLRARAAPDTAKMLVRDVMLTEYGLLSSSDTLRGALERSSHSLQDIFPVVRGDMLVGSIARQTITERLVRDGDSYVQGAMQRVTVSAEPAEKLTEALRRAGSAGTGDFVPVAEHGYLVGVLTPQNLGRAMQQVRFKAGTRE